MTWTADGLLRHTVYVGLREDTPGRTSGVKPRAFARAQRRGELAGAKDRRDLAYFRDVEDCALPMRRRSRTGSTLRPLFTRLSTSFE